jgi:hypothetical protein
MSRAFALHRTRRSVRQRVDAWARWFSDLSPWEKVGLLVNVFVVVVLGAFVFSQLHPELIFRNNTPSGGDMGAHVWQPAFLRDHLLHHFRLTGWAPDWYAGFPVLVFYFPLPSLLIVLLNVLLPYGIAFKLVTILGVVTLPAAVWFLGRSLRLPDPGPACLAAATLPYLFDRTWTIYGGNIASTLAGEFAFSISLAVGVVFLGVMARGLQTGKYRALAAVLLAITGLCHMIPTFFVVGGAAVLVLTWLDWRRIRWSIPVFAVGGLLAGFWSIPFLFRLPYTNDMGWEKITTYATNLFPPRLDWLVMGAALGGLVSIARRRRAGVFLAGMAILSALAFVVAPQGRLWNARILPFWWLTLYLLAGLLLAEIGIAVSELIQYAANRRNDYGVATIFGPLAVLGLSLVIVGYPLHDLPFGHTDSYGRYHWMGFTTYDRSFVSDWASWNYSGYEQATGPSAKRRHDEYFNLMATMAQVGKTQGCGRAMWEYEPELDQMGTPMAPMLLPYWTHGCIGSMEGLFFESSATTPYHFLDQSELSQNPSRAQRNLPYRSLDVKDGVAHLQLLGVRYYMAISPQAQAQADNEPALHLIATSRQWMVNYSSTTSESGTATSGPQPRTWKIYEVDKSEEVTPLTDLPNVVQGLPKGGKGWLASSVSWYQNADRWDVPLAVSGPPSWPRLTMSQIQTPQRVPTAPTTVSNIRTGDDSISFDVSQIGTPVLVKASYFPNWQASGAQGPWRVTPNLMVVVPTSAHVRLHYGYTPVDGLGYLASLLGLIGVVALARRGQVDFPVRAQEARLSRVDRRIVAVWERLEDELVAAQVAAGYPWVPVDFEAYGYALDDVALGLPPPVPAPAAYEELFGPDRTLVPVTDGNGADGHGADAHATGGHATDGNGHAADAPATAATTSAGTDPADVLGTEAD